jgi:hypothetical protein
LFEELWSYPAEPSVEVMVEGVLRLYRSGVFFANSDGLLDADFARWFEYENSGITGSL